MLPQHEIDLGVRGTCQVCGRVIRISLPGPDGSRAVKRHGPRGSACAGGGRPAVEHPPLGVTIADPTPTSVVAPPQGIGAALEASRELGHVVVEHHGLTMDAALDVAFGELGIDVLGGASGHGWSRYRDLQLCPYKFFLKHHYTGEPVVQRPPGGGLQVGTLYHALMAVYYLRMIQILGGTSPDAAVAEAGVLCDLTLEAGADPEYVNEAWRLFEAYANYYESIGDVIVPVAVEKLVVAADGGADTCRYDLVARVEHDTKNYRKGLYVVEHKTASRLDHSVQEGWHLDGEVIGQLMLWRRAALEKLYGEPLAGVIVNVAVKTKIPKFHREIVSPAWELMERQQEDLVMWKAVEQVYKATDFWPRALASCWGRYGACEFFEHCSGGIGGNL